MCRRETLINHFICRHRRLFVWDMISCRALLSTDEIVDRAKCVGYRKIDVLCGETSDYTGLNESVGTANRYDGPITTRTSFSSLTPFKIVFTYRT